MFSTADGNLSFTQVANLISSMFKEAHEGINFYQEGDPVTDVSYPTVVWRNAERLPAVEETGHRPKTVEIVRSKDGQGYTRKISVTRNVLRMTVKAETPAEATRVAEVLEGFVEEIIGALMKLGIKRVYYAGSKDLDPEKTTGKTISRRMLEWVIYEERSIIVKDSTIEKVELFLKTVTEEGEGEDFVSSSFR
jgi:hypothetical protein